MHPFRWRIVSLWSLLAVSLLTLAAIQAGAWPHLSWLGTEHRPQNFGQTVLEVPLYGDTPAMSWSPDGRYLAFNSAHLGSLSEQAELRQTQGLYVFDSVERSHARWTSVPAFQPLWVGDTLLASFEEAELEGVYAVQASGDLRPVFPLFVYELFPTEGGGAVVNEHYESYELDPQRTLTLDEPDSADCDTPFCLTPLADEPEPRARCEAGNGEVEVVPREGQLMLYRRGDPPVVFQEAQAFRTGIAVHESPDEYLDVCLQPGADLVAYVVEPEGWEYGLDDDGPFQVRVVSVPPPLADDSLRHTMHWRRIYGEDVTMGQALSDAEYDVADICEAAGLSECDVDRVALSIPEVEIPGVLDFDVLETEVTRAQWAQCVAAGTCPAVDEAQCLVWNEADWNTGRPLPTGSQQPTAPRTCVTRTEASSFCGWAGGRLPTEAEWHRAAFSLACNDWECPGTNYPWGSGWPWSPSRVRYAAHQPVQLDSVWSRWWGITGAGLWHMSGNAAEWVADDACRYDEWPEGAAQCVNDSGQGVVRGGSFADDPFGVRLFARQFVPVDRRVDAIGFRCVRDVE